MRRLLPLGAVIVLVLFAVTWASGCRANPAVQHNARGVDLAEAGQYEEAIADYARAIELDPNLAQPFYNRGLCYKAQGKKTQAIVDFQEFITLTSNPQWIEMAKQQIAELSK